MRVLLLSHSGGTGGATRSLQAVAADLQSAECKVSILAPAGNMNDEWRDTGIKVFPWTPPYCPWMFGPVYASGVVKFHPILVALLGVLPWRLLRSMQVLKKVLSEGSYDCIHINSLTLFPLAWILPAVIKSQATRPKVIWHLRELLNPGLLLPIRKMIVRMISKQSDQIIAITQNEAEAFGGHRSMHVIHNTIPSKWVARSYSIVEHDAGNIKVVMAAALSAAKGLKEYLEVAIRLNEEHPQVKFDLFTPKQKNTLVSRFPANSDTQCSIDRMLEGMQMMQLSEGVNWKFGHAITPELYREYSIYIRPDHAACPWGRDIIEAMWMGMPVIATGTYDGFVVDGETGFLIFPGDHEALKRKILLLITDSELRVKMGRASQKRAKAMFAPEIHAQKIKAVFGIQSESDFDKSIGS